MSQVTSATDGLSPPRDPGSSQNLPTAALSLPSVTATTLRPSRSTIVEM